MIKCYEIQSKVATARLFIKDGVVVGTDGILCYLNGRCESYVERYCEVYGHKIREIV